MAKRSTTAAASGTAALTKGVKPIRPSSPPKSAGSHPTSKDTPHIAPHGSSGKKCTERIDVVRLERGGLRRRRPVEFGLESYCRVPALSPGSPPRETASTRIVNSRCSEKSIRQYLVPGTPKLHDTDVSWARVLVKSALGHFAAKAVCSLKEIADTSKSAERSRATRPRQE